MNEHLKLVYKQQKINRFMLSLMQSRPDCYWIICNTMRATVQKVFQ